MKKQVYSLETTRTMMRPLSTEDAKFFFQLNEDMDVLRFTGDDTFIEVESARIFLSNYNQYEKYQVGRFAVIHKNTGEWLGWCGLKYSPDTDEYDIGFRFFKQFWNQGYATETAAKCIEYGFKKLNIQLIIGRAMKENTGSVKVLEKLGMHYKQAFDFDGKEGVVYETFNELHHP